MINFAVGFVVGAVILAVSMWMLISELKITLAAQATEILKQNREIEKFAGKAVKLEQTLRDRDVTIEELKGVINTAINEDDFWSDAWDVMDPLLPRPCYVCGAKVGEPCAEGCESPAGRFFGLPTSCSYCEAEAGEPCKPDCAWFQE